MSSTACAPLSQTYESIRNFKFVLVIFKEICLLDLSPKPALGVWEDGYRWWWLVLKLGVVGSERMRIVWYYYLWALSCPVLKIRICLQEQNSKFSPKFKELIDI